jgi:serine/threonine protein kinase
LRRPAAVKLLPRDRNSPGELARFEREVQSMSKLAHPNTALVFDYGHSAEGGLYYAMEYLAPGIDLAELVRTGGRQPADRVAAILAQICGALGEAHEQGLVHRDVKPGNIILCERGGVPDIAKVVDFGIAKAIGEDVGEIFGTPGYVAPEALDRKPVGPAADLYAVGAVGYFLLAGRRAFEGSTAEICRAQLRSIPESPDVAPALAAIVMRCLEIDPAARYASAGALAAALRALPRVGDWDEARARAWWRDRPRGETAVTPSASTDSITIDLGERVDVRNA